MAQHHLSIEFSSHPHEPVKVEKLILCEVKETGCEVKENGCEGKETGWEGKGGEEEKLKAEKREKSE